MQLLLMEHCSIGAVVVKQPEPEVDKENENPEEEERNNVDDLNLESFGKKKKKSKKKPFVMDDMEAPLLDVESKAPEGEVAEEQEVGNKHKHDVDK
jgi:hypothetical protein